MKSKVPLCAVAKRRASVIRWQANLKSFLCLFLQVMNEIRNFLIVDDTTFETTISLDENGSVSSISNSYVDQNLDHHQETIRYSEDPFPANSTQTASGQVR